jgi:hypothetical protein
MKRAGVLALLLAGCASAPPDAATVAVHAENGEARIQRVDGRTVLATASLRIAPGRRRLVVFCRYNTGIMIGDAQSAQREIVAELAAAVRYRIDARMRPEPCSITLAEEPR